MKKLMFAVASAMAVGLVAQAAEQWFDGGIADGWPTAPSMDGGAWSNTEGSAFAESKVTVSADESAPLTFTATTAKQVADDTVTINSTLTFTPFDELPDVPEEAKAGVISYDGNFYVIAKGDEVNEWTDSGISAKDSAVVKVTFIDADTAVYDIDGSVSTNDIVAITEVSKVCMSGDGAISGLTAQTEAKSVGPQTPPTGGGSVTPAEGEPGVYDVQPSPEGNVTIIPDSLKPTDTIRVTTSADVQVTGVPADQIQVKLNDTVIPNSVFVGGDATGFSTALNPEGSAQVGSETIKVTPELSEAGDPSGVEPFVLGDDATVGAKTIPGLTYTLVRQTAPKGGSSEDVDSRVAESARTELTDSDKPADKAFYIIRVTK